MACASLFTRSVCLYRPDRGRARNVHGKKPTGAGTCLGAAPSWFSLVLIGLSLISCGGAVREPFEQIIQQTYPLDGTASVTVTNDDGSIRIYGGGDELKVQATKKAYSSDRLRRIKINIDVRSDLASITTNFPPKQKWGWSDPRNTEEYKNCDICANDIFRESWKNTGVERKAFPAPPPMGPVAKTAGGNGSSDQENLVQMITERVMAELSKR